MDAKIAARRPQKRCAILQINENQCDGRRADGKALPAWEEALFAAMERNAVHVTDFFRLPADDVVEIGRQVAI